MDSSKPVLSPTVYKVVVHQDDDGCWGEVPELEGCFTQGHTPQEVQDRLPEAIAGYLDVDEAQVQIEVCEMVA